MTHSQYYRYNKKQSGMSLIEILVGLVIGLIGMLVIFQTMAIWGERTATTVSGGDARTTGAIGMYSVEQDLVQSGLGFGRTNFAGRQFVPGCDIAHSGGNFLLVAVDINDGASGAPDTITVLYGGSSDENVNFGDVALFSPDKEVGAGMFSFQGLAFSQNDWVVLANQTNCELTRISSTAKTLNLISFSPAPTTVTNGNLLYLGSQPQRATWSVSGNSLLRTPDVRFDAATTAATISDGVIDLQAQYVLADGTWQDADPADWSQVRAVKIALLLRSKQFEKTDVTTTQPAWHLSDGSTRNFTMSNLGDGTAWQRYRYEVFERTIPLRNLIWGAQEP